MKRNYQKTICQLCFQEMSTLRIKRHVNTKHKEISLEDYLQKYYEFLPLHQPCVVCKKKISHGFKLLRFWESDIKKNTTQIIESIKNEIK